MARFLLGGTKRILAAMATHPDLQQALTALRRFESQGDIDGAQEQLRQVLAHVQEDLAAIDNIAGHMRQRQYPLGHVLAAYEKYLAAHPAAENAAFNYAYNLAKDAQFDAAIDMYERALQMGISAPEEVHLNIANIYMDHLHDHGKARQHLQAALRENSGYASAYYNLGNLSEQEGDRDEARRCFERCLALDPANESALARIADTQAIVDRDDPVLARLISTAANSTNGDLHMALGKAYEQLRDFDMAWRHFTKANDLDRSSSPPYRPEQAEAHFDSIKAQCGSDWVSRFGGTSREHVFICGMFRSGSTLLEQMLAAHPSFRAAGESEFFPRLRARALPDYPHGLSEISNKDLREWQRQHEEQTRKIFGETGRLTDKRPDNFLYLGLIKAVLPSAKFVVTERDWRDIATSIYSVRLGAGQTYATSLAHIRHYIGLQTDLVNHWENVLGADLKRVRYEDLVLNPEATVTGLLEWLGESWDERCLAFHELRNSVKTASVWQVREPLHARSIARWKHYGSQFAEVFGDECNG